MNRNEYMAILSHRLQKLPDEEIQNAMDYYAEYFDEAGIENEQSVMDKLGTPAQVASQIIAKYAITDADAIMKEEQEKKYNNKTNGDGFSKVWTIILAVFAAPIALPLAFGAGVVAIAMVFTIAVLLLSFVIAAIAFIVSGIIGIIVSFLVLSHFPTALLLFGTSLFFCGIGLLTLIGTATLYRVSLASLGKRLGKFILRRDHSA